MVILDLNSPKFLLVLTKVDFAQMRNLVIQINELGMNRVASFADDRYLLSKFLCFELIAGHKITKACCKIRSDLRIKCRKGRTLFG